CNFCGGKHFIRECEVVEEYTRAGKCRRNTEGKVVLPGGGFVPKATPGQFLKDRFDEWHNQHPGQMATGTLFHSIADQQGTTISTDNHTQTFQLRTEDRIASLKAELYNLERSKKPFQPVIRTRAQRSREQEADHDNHEFPPPAPRPHSPSVPPTQAPAPVQRRATPQRQSQSPTAGNGDRTDIAPPQAPEHPFRAAADAVYAPPRERNVGAPADKSHANRREPAYRTLPPVHDSAIASKVYDRSM
ncbi:hypothetical protein HYPSUDRAFT_115371, partial [Hypholoma sublateritium FD-334 SS-4]